MPDDTPKISGFPLLLAFMGNDNRIPDAIRWQFSIKAKLFAMEISYGETLEQIPKCLSELEEIHKRGYGKNIEHLKLAVRYECFLNAIYSLCENVSTVTRHLCRSANLPRRFRDQKSAFLKNTRIDPEYSRILAETTWYDEVHELRAESIHYLSGLITFSGSSELGYFNVPKSQRKGSLVKITIPDIETQAKQIRDGVRAFLTQFGNHFIPLLDQSSRQLLVCISTSDKVVGVRSISLKEYLNNEQWTCQGSKECPERALCQAKKS